MSIDIGWPEGIWIGLAIITLFVHAEKHGKPRDNYNFASTFVSVLVTILILAWGGFFS